MVIIKGLYMGILFFFAENLGSEVQTKTPSLTVVLYALTLKQWVVEPWN